MALSTLQMQMLMMVSTLFIRSCSVIVQVLDLPKVLHDEVAEQHVYLLIGGQGVQQQAQLLPDTPQTKQFLQSLSTNVFFWQHQEESGRVKSFVAALCVALSLAFI